VNGNDNLLVQLHYGLEGDESVKDKYIEGFLRGSSVGTLKEVDVVICLVDVVDKEHFAESRKELDSLLKDDSLINVPFFILGNERDITYATLEEELCYYLGLENYRKSFVIT